MSYGVGQVKHESLHRLHSYAESLDRRSQVSHQTNAHGATGGRAFLCLTPPSDCILTTASIPICWYGSSSARGGSNQVTTPEVGDVPLLTGEPTCRAVLPQSQRRFLSAFSPTLLGIQQWTGRSFPQGYAAQLSPPTGTSAISRTRRLSVSVAQDRFFSDPEERGELPSCPARLIADNLIKYLPAIALSSEVSLRMLVKRWSVRGGDTCLT